MKSKLFHLFTFILTISVLKAQPQSSPNSSDIFLQLKKLNTTGSVLYVAAHPDDENTRLLSYLAKERNVRTAYVSLTRGDGGQNLIGEEQGPLLGLIRSFELMAARKIDGAEQFFTRAYDFGYSKSPEETFDIWDREKVLADLVFIIRYFKPDIVITRFATDGSGGHGHHTASAILAEEAFAAAGDPKRYPEHFLLVQPWQAERLLYNNASRFRNPNADMSGNIQLNIGKYNSLLGRSYGEIAGLSRSMHKSQGFGSSNMKGDVYEYFKPISGSVPEHDIFDGIDLNLSRLEGSASFAANTQKALDNYKLDKPETIVPFLLEAYKNVETLKDPFWRKVKKKELEDLIIASSGIWLESTTKDFTLYNGEEGDINLFAINRSGINVNLDAVSIGLDNYPLNLNLEENQLVTNKVNWTAKANESFSGPYWLKDDPQDGVFNFEDLNFLKKPVDDAHIICTFQLNIEGQTIDFTRPLQYKWVDPTQGEQFRMTELIPPIMLNPVDKVLVFSDNEPKTLKVVVKGGKPGFVGKVSLKAHPDYSISPPYRIIEFKNKLEEQIIEFSISPGDQSGKSELSVVCHHENEIYDRGYRQIIYDHIPIQVLFPKATVSIVNLDIKRNKSKIAYIPGAGDEVMKGIQQMNYHVTEIAPSEIDKVNLNAYQSIVLGIRAFNTNEKLVSMLPLLHEYVSKGGTLIVQYNTNSWAGPLKNEIGPYPLTIGRGRVTDEKSPVKLDSTHALLNFPNKITIDDFQDWVQERGLYFATSWDTKYETPISFQDPGENFQDGGLVVAKYGSGYFVYTGISFFRQIPAGNPGAFKLLSNIIELGGVNP